MATAPTPAFAHGTTAPTAKYFDWTATPTSLVAGSAATIEKVDGFPRGHYSLLTTQITWPVATG